LKISHEVSKAYRQIYRIINRLAVMVRITRKKKAPTTGFPAVGAFFINKITLQR